MTPRVLVIVGTPLSGSLARATADAYISGLGERADVRVIDLAQDSIPSHPRSKAVLRAADGVSHLEADVQGYIADVDWAQHVVIAYPQWWGTQPAALKAFIDRVFIARHSFAYDEGLLPKRLLTGRTARVFMTMDSPRFWNRLVYRNASETSITKAVLEFCGIKVRGIHRFGPVRTSKPAGRATWLESARKAGEKDAGRLSRSAAAATARETVLAR
ncbi:MAG: NAD(P)H-dependent oxidoreductase [Rhodoglobus sp.]